MQHKDALPAKEISVFPQSSQALGLTNHAGLMCLVVWFSQQAPKLPHKPRGGNGIRFLGSCLRVPAFPQAQPEQSLEDTQARVRARDDATCQDLALYQAPSCKFSMIYLAQFS